MRKLPLYIIGVSFFVLASPAQIHAASGYTGSGFGDSNANQDFTLTHDCDSSGWTAGNEAYKAPSGWYLIFQAAPDNFWRIYYDLNGGANCDTGTYSTSYLEYYNTSGTNPLNTSSFTVYTGTNPGGIMTEDAGGGGGASTTPPVIQFGTGTTTCVTDGATTTCSSQLSTLLTDNPTQDLATLFGLFFVVFFGVVWLIQ